MASKIIQNLIKYIVSEVQDADGFIFRTKLVKLLYLCDVEYYQSRRETLTGLEWKRYKYGPYAFELPDIMRRMGLDLGEEDLDFEIGHGVRYEAYDVPDPDKWLAIGQKLIIDRVIKRWGNEDLRFLLDYVYCDTAPMRDAQFRESLDFHKIPLGMIRASSDTLELSESIREGIKQLIDKHGTISRKPIPLSLQEVKKQTEDERPIPNLSGIIRCRGDVIQTTEGRE
jgi:hypothetical protein